MKSSSDVDGVGGRVTDRDNGLNSEVETEEVEEVEERSEEGVGEFVGNIYGCQPERFRGRHRSWWTMGKLGCGETNVVLSKDVVVESEAKARPTLPIVSSSHLEYLLDSFGISSRYALSCASWVHISNGFSCLMACLSCRPNTASKSCPSSDRALLYFDKYGAGRVGHGLRHFRGVGIGFGVVTV